MNLLLYTSATDDVFMQLAEIAITFAAKGTAEIFHSLKNLTNRLSQPKNDHTALVLHAATEKELTHMLLINDFLQDTKLILILPDHKESTIAKGHKLHPRFLSYIDSDFADIGAVLNKMFKNTLSENRWHNSDKEKSNVTQI